MKKLLLTLLLLTNLFSWDDALLDAMYAFNHDNATPKQKALILKNNAVINQMRINGQIGDSSYQKTQNYYSSFVQDLGAKVCKQNGATMVVQKRDMTKSYDAGTDSDFITNATSVEQVKAIQGDFNKEFEAHLRKQGLDVPRGTNWTGVNDIDFMVDPDGVDRKTFKEISKIQNDAYSDPDSARYEKKSRNGEQPTLKEIAAYKDEMGRFIDKKKIKSVNLSEDLMEMKKNPNFNKEGTKEWKQRQLTEAKLQQINAQNSKYQDRSIDANSRMAQMLGIDISSSDLPNKAKTRAPSQEVSVQKRAINSATVHSMNKYLSSQSNMTEALLLSVQATEEPQNLKKIQERLKKVTKELTPSQKGEFLERIKNSEGVSKATVKSINKSMKAQSPFSKKSLHVKSSKLAKVGSAFGLVGDLMSISGQLGKASRGEHLLININKEDSSSMKALKQSSVALLELAPVPIMDTLERYDTTDKKAKMMLLRAIARGEDIDPVLMTIMVMSDVAGQTVNAMVIDPLLKGKDAIVEGASTATTVVENYQNKQVLKKDDAKNTERFNEYVKRAETIKLRGISTSAKAKNGSTYSMLDNVGVGDRLYFFVSKNKNWKSEYSTSWEIRKGGTIVQKYPLVSASSSSSNRLVFTNNFSNGNYQIIFRIFNEESKQMDFVTADMRVNQRFGISPIVVLNSSRNAVSSSKIQKNKKYMFGINPIGSWESSYTIEWFLDGDKIKTSSANASQLQYVWVNFDDYVGDGGHQVSVRALKNGKIVAHQSVSVNVKETKKEKKMSALEKLKQKMKKEKNKKSSTQSADSKLDDIFEEGTKTLEVIDENSRQEAEASAKVEQLKRDMERMDREDAEFWSGLAEGFTIAGKAIGEGAKEYQKSSSQYSSKSSSNEDDGVGDWSKGEIGFNLKNENKTVTQKTKRIQYTLIGKAKPGWIANGIVFSNIQTKETNHKVTICGYKLYASNYSLEILQNSLNQDSSEYYMLKIRNKIIKKCSANNYATLNHVGLSQNRSKKSTACVTSRCWKESIFNGDRTKYQYLLKNGTEVKDGQFTRYKKDGSIYKIGLYKDGCRTGTWTHYHTTYQTHEPFKDIVVYENCNIVSSKRIKGH